MRMTPAKSVQVAVNRLPATVLLQEKAKCLQVALYPPRTYKSCQPPYNAASLQSVPAIASESGFNA
jgi:hypothetical protein